MKETERDREIERQRGTERQRDRETERQSYKYINKSYKYASVAGLNSLQGHFSAVL